MLAFRLNPAQPNSPFPAQLHPAQPNYGQRDDNRETKPYRSERKCIPESNIVAAAPKWVARWVQQPTQKLS